MCVLPPAGRTPRWIASRHDHRHSERGRGGDHAGERGTIRRGVSSRRSSAALICEQPAAGETVSTPLPARHKRARPSPRAGSPLENPSGPKWDSSSPFSTTPTSGGCLRTSRPLMAGWVRGFKAALPATGRQEPGLVHAAAQHQHPQARGSAREHDPFGPFRWGAASLSAPWSRRQIRIVTCVHIAESLLRAPSKARTTVG